MPEPRERTWRLGLTGWPLTTSLSPQLHAAALASAGLCGDYGLFPAPPLPTGEEDLRELCDQMRREKLHGVNVTIPHKQSVIPLVDRLTPVAEAIGAVNTLVFRDGKLTGDNTDAPGFLADLAWVFGSEFRSTGAGHLAVVLGAGGSARAVVYALLQSGWKVHIAARRESQARDLVGRKYGDGQISTGRLDAEGLCQAALQASLVVNTTPVGMAPLVSASPWPEELALPAQAFIYDLVYSPTETALVRQARSMCCRAATGLGMLVEQAALAFEIWTGLPADRHAMRRAVDLEPFPGSQGGR